MSVGKENGSVLIGLACAALLMVGLIVAPVAGSYVTFERAFERASERLSEGDSGRDARGQDRVGRDGAGQDEHSQDGQSQDGQSQDAAQERARPRGRLPNYFSRFVTAAQREQVYEIQARFNEEIDNLQMMIAEKIKQRDQAVDGVLTPEQLDQVNRLREEARQRRESRGQNGGSGDGGSGEGGSGEGGSGEEGSND